MFKAKVFSSKFRQKMKDYFDLVKNGEDAIQVVHNGENEPIRVLITQDHYLNLTTKVALYEAQLALSTPTNGKQRESRNEALSRLKERRSALQEESNQFGKSIG